MNQSKLELQNVKITLDENIILNDINLSIQNGEIVSLMGSSASGKTYWAKTIIKLLNENLDDFPDTFLSIDGGIYRESSFVYQSVIYILKNLNLSGISNLVSAGIKSAIIGSLFDSNKIKKHIKEFLKNQIF